MSDERLPAEFLISAHIRLAAREGVPIVVRKRGDGSVGTIILKINRLDGTAHVLSQVRIDDELVWTPVSRTDPMPEAEAERYLEKQAKTDPDAWQIEIEDREGRLWFPGRILSL